MNASTVQVISVNGRKFATGLLWQLLSRPRAYMQEAREIGKREGMDIVAIRTGRVLQAGLADKTSANVGSYSVAASLAGILGEDFVGVFEIDEGSDQYLIVGVGKNGAIIPGCDMIGTKEEVTDKLRQDFNLHNFGRVFCPHDFDYGGEEKRLEDVLDPKRLKNEYKLRPLVGGLSGRQWTRLLLFLVLIAMLAGGAMLYLSHKREKERLAEEAEAAAQAVKLEALHQATGQAVTPKALEHPWATQPTAKALRLACMSGLRQIPLSLGGWTLQSATCMPGMVQAAYQRKPVSTINGLLAMAAQLGYRVDTVDPAGDAATLSWSPPTLSPGGDDPLSDSTEISNAVRSILQGRDASYTFTEVAAPAPPAPPPGSNEPPPPVQDWKTFALSLTGRQNPDDMLVGIEDLPATRVQSIAVSLNGSDLEWTVTGEIHGK